MSDGNRRGVGVGGGVVAVGSRGSPGADDLMTPVNELLQFPVNELIQQQCSQYQQPENTMIPSQQEVQSLALPTTTPLGFYPSSVSGPMMSGLPPPPPTSNNIGPVSGHILSFGDLSEKLP